MPIKNIESHIEDDKLDLSVCNLTEVPLPQIVNLVRISFLDLSGNQLTVLPANFGAELPHICKLDLSSNKLKSLPDTFHKLSGLVHLDLYSNQIRDLSPSLVQLRKLKFLDVSQNPLKPRLQTIVGACKSERECQAAAKNLLTHFQKQKEDVLKERTKMAQKTRVEQQQQSSVKAPKTETPKKSAPAKKATNQPKQQQKHKPSNNGSAKAPPKKTVKDQVKQGGDKSGSSRFTKILFLILLAVLSNCFIINMKGDYSVAGAKAALPRMQKGAELVWANARVALKPENLAKTGATVVENVNKTAYVVGGFTKKYAYQFQDLVEVYTGDLSPYTGQVSRASCAAFAFVVKKCSVAWQFIASQDWAGLYALLAKYASIVYDNLLALWNHPAVVNAREQLWHYLCVAVHLVGVYLTIVFEYLEENVPVWFNAASLYKDEIVSSLKAKVNSLLN